MSSVSISRPQPAHGLSFRNEKLVCVATLTLVFLIGAMAGAAFMTSDSANRLFRRSVPFWTEAGKQISLDNWKNELNLTPAQTEKVAMILEDFAKYYRTVAGDARASIMEILDEGQKKKFEKLLGNARY
jgi:hypothetical protein